MGQCEQILPCLDCPALTKRLQRRDYYLGEPDSEEITDETFDAAYDKAWNIAFATVSTETLEEQARKRGCGGKIIELIEGVEYGETCPVQTAMSNEVIGNQKISSTEIGRAHV